MMPSSAPIIEPLAEQDGKARLPWILFFNQLQAGDLGTAWTPNFINLGNTGGAPAISGRYYQISKVLTYFRIDIDAVGDTTSTAGSTYIDNFPLKALANGVCAVVAGNLGGSLGIIRADNIIYPPSWLNVAGRVTVIGIGEAVQ